MFKSIINVQKETCTILTCCSNCAILKSVDNINQADMDNKHVITYAFSWGAEIDLVVQYQCEYHLHSSKESRN